MSSVLKFAFPFKMCYLCIRKAASRHNIQASLMLLLSICIIFVQDKRPAV